MKRENKKTPSKKAPAEQARPKARKPLTAEQRARKNAKDRERRARLKAEQKADKTKCRKGRIKPYTQNPACAREACGVKCKAGGCNRPAMTPLDVLEGISRAIVKDLLNERPAPKNEPPKCVAKGIVSTSFPLPDGGMCRVNIVDADTVDLSDESLIPYPVRRALLLQRMAEEISEIVERNARDF